MSETHETTMWAWQVPRYGAYRDVLSWQKVQRPVPGPGELLVQVGAAGISFATMLRIAGKYQVKDPLPFIPGTDMAGEVVAGGEGTNTPVGQRVMGTASSGCFAEYALIREEDAMSIPDSLPYPKAAALLNAYQTSYVGLAYQAELKENEWLLVHGAAGGVGIAAVQLGRAMGAKVIACAGGAEKVNFCLEHGAHYAIDHRQEDFVQRVQEITGGHGADVIYDPVGGDIFDASRKCIAFRGRLLVVGFAEGRIPEIAANRILLRTFSVTGFTLHAYRQHAPHLLEEAKDKLFEMVDQGNLTPVIGQTIPLSQLIDAMALVEQRKSLGKTILTVS